MNSESTILAISFKDLFTAKMLKYSILPFVLSVILLYVVFFMLAGVTLDSLGTMEVNTTSTTIENGVPHTDSFAATLQGTALIQFLLSHAITSWIATFLLYTVGAFLALYLSIFVALIIIGFLTPTILKELQRRHYNDVELRGDASIFEFLFLVLKWFVIMVLMFIVFVPLYFIPLVNIIAFNFPLYYFFHKMITYDVSSTICTKDEAMKIKFFHATTLRLKTLALYLISLIPFVIFFAAVLNLHFFTGRYFSL